MNTAKRILIVEPASSGLNLIVEAKELGLEVIIASFDSNDRFIPKEYRSFVSYFVIVDTNDEIALSNKIYELNKQLPLDAVLPGFEYYVPIVARINSHLGLPGLPPETVDALRNKSIMRECLHTKNLRIPAFAVITSASELEEASTRIGFPAVVKPVDSSGSIHVSRVDSIEELREAYSAIRADVSTDFGRRTSKDVLIEAYIEGSEFSVEGFIDGDNIYFISITEKLLGSEPHFVEVGHIVEAYLNSEMIEKIYIYVSEVVRALGVTLGPFHCELRYSNKGPVIIELGARLPGDHIVELISLSRGISLPRIMIESYLGCSLSCIEKIEQPSRYAGIRFLTASDISQYNHIYGLQELELEPGFVKYEINIKAGELIPPLSDFRGRIGFAIFTALNYGESKFRLNSVDRLITFC
jgi:biotin carboxylase